MIIIISSINIVIVIRIISIMSIISIIISSIIITLLLLYCYLPAGGHRGLGRGDQGDIELLIEYTRSPLQDSRLFGPSPWKILALIV